MGHCTFLGIQIKVKSYNFILLVDYSISSSIICQYYVLPVVVVVVIPDQVIYSVFSYDVQSGKCQAVCSANVTQ